MNTGLKKILYINLIISLFIFFSYELYSQERQLRRADSYFEAGEYFRAAEEYNKVIRKIDNRSLRADIQFKMGESYLKYGDYRRARTTFRRTSRVSRYEIPSMIRLADVEKILGNYEAAFEIYEEILANHPGDSLALIGIESCSLAIAWLEEPTRYEVEYVREFSSRFNDFSPFVDERPGGFDHVYFSSTREDPTLTRRERRRLQRSGITGEVFADLYVSRLNRRGEWSDIEPLDSLNNEGDQGTPVLVDGGRRILYTSCLKDDDQRLGCQIYEASRVDGVFMNPQRLNIVPDSISVGHPAVSSDGNMIIFSARMTGGFGGADLWFVEMTEEGWSRPRNLGQEINSDEDELFPFLRGDSTLYYSSAKQPSMGGLDIFKAKMDERGRWRCHGNLKPPFNSHGNDFGIYFYANEEKGYFTSDRRRSRNEDIYRFEMPPLQFKLEGIVKDKDEGFLIDSCVVMLFGSDGTVFRDTTSFEINEGQFSFRLRKNTDYVFVVTKDGYFNGRARFTTDSLEFSKVFEFEIELENYDKPIEIPNIEFEFARWDLTDSSKIILDTLIQLMNENPHLVIELSAHTDMVGSEEANMELSQRRANSVVEYLISRGIAKARLVPKGYGKGRPKVISEPDLRYPFLPEGAELSEEFVLSLEPEQQVVANQQNRRIEMRVLSNDYMPSLD